MKNYFMTTYPGSGIGELGGQLPHCLWIDARPRPCNKSEGAAMPRENSDASNQAIQRQQALSR
jgi:hypothetical protein